MNEQEMKPFEEWVLPVSVVSRHDISSLVNSAEKIDEALTEREARSDVGVDGQPPVEIAGALKDFIDANDLVFDDKDQRDTVLPDSSRTWTVPLENIGTFGKYTVQATFTYGEKNQTIEATRSFWVIPTWVIVAAIVGLVLLVGAIVLAVWLIVRHRKNNGPKGLMHGRHGHYRR